MAFLFVYYSSASGSEWLPAKVSPTMLNSAFHCSFSPIFRADEK